MTKLENTSPDSVLAVRVAKLWPHREHESNSMLAFLCCLGMHRWRKLDLASLAPGKSIFHCFWCSKIKIELLLVFEDQN